MIKKYLLAIAISTLFIFLFSLNLHAAQIQIGRPLPIDNLNSDAGANRSNVAWGFFDEDGTSFYSGDDFIIEETNKWNQWFIREFSVWFVNPYVEDDTFSLYIDKGFEGDTSLVSTNFTVAKELYDDGSTYQGSSKNFLDMYKLTFTFDGLGLRVDANEYYNFTAMSDQDNPFFLHATNEKFAGIDQPGADDLYKWFREDGSYGGTLDSDGWGWNKSSDINFVLNANPVPEPGTLALLGIGLAGLGFFGYRRRNKA